MDHYDNYINEIAKVKGKYPRQGLEEFVSRYISYISAGSRKKIIDTYSLRALDEKDQLMEFVQSKNPYKVLEQCFSPGRLHRLAEDEFGISPDLGLRDHELISEILYNLGFKNEVKPIGLSHIENDISQSLEATQNISQLSLNDVRGICVHMSDTVEEIMQVLFLFHIGVLQDELAGRQLDELTEIKVETEQEEETDGESEPEKKKSPAELCSQYKQQRTKQMGHFVGYLKDLMNTLGGYYELREYCQKSYGCDVPLTQNQLGQLGMFTAYRNIIIHSRENLNWRQNKNTAETGLSTMEENSDTSAMWQESWNTIVEAWNSDQDFPEHEMIQIMATFLREFLDLLSNGIYPKVIVIRSYEVDEYGTVTIHFDSSDPNDTTKSIDFTDRNFNFNFHTFTEFYYRSRPNLTSIDPILVRKQGLEDWAIPSDNNAESQKGGIRMQKAEFDALVEKWEKMDYNSFDDKKAASTFYDEYIFPFVKETFINNPKNRPNKEYDGLILPLGYSPEPLILSILAIKPERVGLLYTNETEKLLPRIQGETALTLDQLDKLKIDGSSTVDVYKAIMELYEKWERPKNVAVDITGGKKSMVGGAAMAGAVLSADIFYVDNTKFTHGKPEPCSEYLNLLDNPYTVFGDLEVEKARDLYNRHDYTGASRIFDQLAKQVGNPDLIMVYEAYGLLCAIYEAWDNLDFENVINSIIKLHDILGRISSDRLAYLSDFQTRLLTHKTALECLQAIAKDEKLALCIPDGFHFAFMLYQSALRRENQGKLDMACLLLYRLLEWIEQHRLELYGINSSEPDYAKSGRDPDDLLNAYKTKRKGLYSKNKKNIESLPSPIALIDGFLVLDTLDDDIVHGLRWGALRGQVDMRNKNIFAHGISKISPDNYEKFKTTVEKRFEKAQEIAGIDADSFNEQHQFIAPLP